MTDIYLLIQNTSPSAAIIISVACMLICGFLMTRVTNKLRLPTVTAYIVVGILLGPFVLNVIPPNVITGMDFLADIAVSLIAFSAGEFFRFSVLKRNGPKVIVIALFEATLASLSIFLLTHFVLGLRLEITVVLTALAAITAPTSTMMIIRQTRAKGEFVNTLLPTIALDEMIGLIAYSVAISLALSTLSNQAFGMMTVLKPILSNIGSLLVGAIFGFLLKLLLTYKFTTDNRLIVSLAVLFTFCGLCSLAGISPLLGCISMGTIYINLTDDNNLFKQLNYFSPPFLLLFFVRSGLNFQLDAVLTTSSAVGSVSLLTVGITYTLVRIVGKYTGAFLGSAVTRRPQKVRNFLGMALLPQAGVTIGLAALAARSIGGESGEALQTIILTSGTFYELIGPACSKLALYLSGSYSNALEDLVPEPAISDKTDNSQLEMLIARINAIQKELPKHSHPSEEELAFSEAAEEHYVAIGATRHKHPRFFSH